MSKGGGGSETTTSTSQPWGPAQGYLVNMMDAAQQQYANNVGGWTGTGTTGDPWRYQSATSPMPSTVAPYSSQTNSALNTIANRANQNILQGNPLVQGGEAALGQMLSPSGFQTPQNTANAAASGSISPTNQQAQGLFENIAQGQGANPFTNRITTAGATPTSAGVDTLSRTSAGDYLNSNPHLDAAFGRAADQIQDRVKAQFFGQGSGSAYQQDTLQRGLSDLATSIYLPAYESERDRQQAAAGNIAGIQQNDLARQLGAETTAGGLFNQDLLNRMGAGAALQGQSSDAFGGRLAGAGLAGNLAGQKAGVQGQGLGLLPTVQGAQQQDAQNLLGVGAMQDAKTQQYLNDLLQRWNAPFNELAKYSGIVSGLGGLGGTSVSTGPQQNQNTGANLGSLFSGAAALGGLFSDRRLKSDIRIAGVDARGLTWYAYRYLWDAPGTEHIGVMADEAPAEAVHEHTLGVKIVDYATLAEAGHALH